MGVLQVGSRIEHSDGVNVSRLERPSNHVLQFSTIGTFTTAAGVWSLDATALVIGDIGDIGGGLCAFFDWSQMTGYSSEGRSLATSFMLKHRSAYTCAVFLTTSTMVSMGVNVANMVLGGFLEGTTQRATFEARLAQQLERDRR